jgi:hypothetical protein
MNKDHPKEKCSKDYNGSSKGMEVCSSCTINVNWVHEKKCYARKYINDDNSSTKSILRWLLQEALKVYQVPWPRTASNNNNKDNGLLHILHEPIKFLADANHHVTVSRPLQVRYLPQAVYQRELVKAPVPTNGEQMKRNMGYPIQQNKAGDFDQMGKAMPAVLKHQFDDHIHCGA